MHMAQDLDREAKFARQDDSYNLDRFELIFPLTLLSYALSLPPCTRTALAKGTIAEWTIREQLILASAVQRSGDQNW